MDLETEKRADAVPRIRQRCSKAEAVPLRDGMTVAEGFQTIVKGCLRHYRSNERQVISALDADALHQARVALRRLRAAMSLFRTAVDGSEFVRIRDELRWFAGELGEARNLDVYLEADSAGVRAHSLQAKREAAYKRATAAITSPRVESLMLDIVSWASVGDWRGGEKASRRLTPYVDRRIDRLWKRARRADRLKRMSDGERHEFRILVKKLRYALEFTEALHAGPRGRKKFIEAIKNLQDELGFLNDAAVARTMAGPEDWTLSPFVARHDEQHLLRKASRSLKRLRKIGPYWRR
jgi:triphosphatase